MHRISTQVMEETGYQKRTRERQMDAQITAQEKKIGDVSIKLAVLQEELSKVQILVHALSQGAARKPSGSIAGQSEGYSTSIDSSPRKIGGRQWRGREQSLAATKRSALPSESMQDEAAEMDLL